MWIFGWARIDIEDEARVFLREIPTVLRLKREDRGAIESIDDRPNAFVKVVTGNAKPKSAQVIIRRRPSP